MKHHWLLACAVSLSLSACSGDTASDTHNADNLDQPSTNTGESANAREQQDIISIAPSTVACTGVAERQCLLVRHAGEDDWQYFYDNIDGFEYLAGYHWTLETKRIDVPNPPADGSSVRWELVRVLEQMTAQVPSAEGSEELLEVAPTLALCGDASGNEYDCLRIRTLGSDTWSTWPNIEGYQHQPGIASTLRLRNSPWPDQAEQTTPFRRQMITLISNQTG